MLKPETQVFMLRFFQPQRGDVCTSTKRYLAGLANGMEFYTSPTRKQGTPETRVFPEFSLACASALNNPPPGHFSHTAVSYSVGRQSVQIRPGVCNHCQTGNAVKELEAGKTVV